MTGATGLIGAHLVRDLVRHGYRVRAFVRAESNRAALADLPVELAYGDILTAESLDAAARDCEVVFHVASPFTYWGLSREQLRHVAVQGAVNAVEATARARARRMVLTSSSAVCGSSASPVARDESAEPTAMPTAAYVLAKIAQERAAFARAAEVGVDLVTVCPTMTVGPHDHRLGPSNRVIVNYLADVSRSTFPGGCNIVAAADVARGHRLVAERGRPGCRYLLGSENLDWKTIHQSIGELCGVGGPRLHLTHTAAYLAATAHEVAAWVGGGAPSVTRAEAAMVGRYHWYRHDRAAALGYAPRPARQALAEAIAWIVTTPHVSRELRTSLTLSREVYAARRALGSERRRPARPRIAARRTR